MDKPSQRTEKVFLQGRGREVKARAVDVCVFGGGGGWSVRIYCLGVVVASANLFIMHEPN